MLPKHWFGCIFLQNLQPNQCFGSVLLQKPCILQVESASEERFSKGRLLLLLAVVLVVVVLVVVVLGSGSGCFGCGSGCLGCLWVVVVVVVALLVVFAPSLLQPSKLKQLKVESPGSLNP